MAYYDLHKTQKGCILYPMRWFLLLHVLFLITIYYIFITYLPFNYHFSHLYLLLSKSR